MKRHIFTALRWLGIAGLPFVLISGYEAYVLTLQRGPQLLFFSISRANPWLYGVTILSFFFFVGFLILGVILIALRLAGRAHVGNIQLALLSTAVVLGIAHGILFLAYDHWAFLLQ